MPILKSETPGCPATMTIAYAISQEITFDEIAQTMDILELDYANQDVRLSAPVVEELMKVLVDKFSDQAISMEIVRF